MSTSLKINFLAATTTYIDYTLTGTVTGTVYTVSLKLGTVPVLLSGDTSKIGGAGTISGRITTGALNNTNGPYLLEVQTGTKRVNTKIYYIVNLGWSSTYTEVVGNINQNGNLSIGANLYASDVIVGGNSLLAYLNRPSRPTNVGLSLAGDGGTVTWTLNGNAATSYSVSVYSSSTSTVTTSSTLVTTATPTASGQTITFAKESQKYYAVTVRAVNSAGNGPVSAISTAVQYELIPTLAPTNVALSLPAGSVTFTPNGGAATSYSISVYSSATSTVTTSSTLVTTVTSSASGQVITFAKQDQLYYAVTVVAINSLGNSPASTISSAVRYILPPLAPTNVALSLPTGTVTWTPGGGVATSYSVSVYSSSTSTVTTSSTLVTTVASSASGQVIAFTKQDQLYYAVTVVAINAGGNGSASAISTAVRYILPTLAPTNVALSLPTGTVTWTPNGGAATSYSVSVYSSSTSTVTTSSTLVTTVTSSASGQTIAFTKEDQKYYAVTVVAINSLGNSSASAISSAVRYIPTAPLAPTNIVLTFSANGGNVTWTPGGGGTPTVYNIDVYSSATSTVTTSSTRVGGGIITASGQEVTFTKQDQMYYALTVTPENSGGYTNSAISSSVRYVVPPLAPTNIVLSLSGGGGTVTWTPGGGGIPTSYAIDIYSNSTSTVTTSSTRVGSATITASGQAIVFTKQDQLYYAVTVTPVNSGGYANSAISSSVRYILPPLAPTNVGLSLAGGGGTVTFTPNGGAATSYSVSVYSSATSTVTTSSTLVTTVTSSASGQAITFTKEHAMYYAVTVVATNLGGNSPASTISTAVQYLVTPTLAPTNVGLTFNANGNIVTWTPNGGVATSYSISVYSSATSTVTTSSTLVTTVTSSASGQAITFAKEDQKYYAVTVVAINAAGNSPASAISITVRYIEPPLAPTNVVLTLFNTYGVINFTPNGNPAVQYTVRVYSSETSTVTTSSTLVWTSQSVGGPGTPIGFTVRQNIYFAATVQGVSYSGIGPVSAISSAVIY